NHDESKLSPSRLQRTLHGRTQEYTNPDPTAECFQKHEQHGTDLKREPQVSRRHAKYIVCARTEKVSADAYNQSDRKRKSNHASGQFRESLRKCDESC